MSERICVLCESRITDDNDSREHLIPNAIGGRRKVRGFVCNACNNKTGHLWDAALAKQLNPLSLFFRISRENGSVPSQIFETTGGGKLQVSPNGSLGLEKPEYKESSSETGIRINVNARSSKETRKILSGIKRKYPQVDIDELLNKAVSKSFYPKDMLKFNLAFGGKEAGRALVKSTLALAVDSGVDPLSCKVARDYLTTEAGEACFGYYYEKDLVKNRPEGVIFHCVAVSGVPTTKQLLGYVEYFSAQRMVVCLSDNYKGEFFLKTYAIDPISGKEIDLEVDLSLSTEDVSATYRYEKIPEGAVKNAFEKIIPIGLKKSQEQEKDRVINEAIEYAFKACGIKEGENLTEEQVSRIPKFILEKLEAFIIHQSKG